MADQVKIRHSRAGALKKSVARLKKYSQGWGNPKAATHWIPACARMTG